MDTLFNLLDIYVLKYQNVDILRYKNKEEIDMKAIAIKFEEELHMKLKLLTFARNTSIQKYITELIEADMSKNGAELGNVVTKLSNGIEESKQEEVKSEVKKTKLKKGK